MQWSHLISDKWAPRFHSLWSRSSFLVSTFLFFCQRNHVCGHFSALQICREGAKTQHWAGTIYERNYLLPVPTMLAKLFWIHISVFIPVQFLEMFFSFFFVIMIDQKFEKDLMIGVKEYNFDIRKIFSPLKRLARSQNHPFFPTLYLESFLCSLSAAPYI